MTVNLDLGSAINWSPDLLDTDSQAYSDALQIILDAFQGTLNTLASDNSLSVDGIDVSFNDGSSRRRRATDNSNVNLNLTFTKPDNMHDTVFSSRVRRVVRAALRQSAFSAQHISTKRV